MSKAGTLADNYEQAVGMVALGNAVPFVGPLTIDADIKKFLFCRGFGNCTEGYQLLVVGQNLVSITIPATMETENTRSYQRGVWLGDLDSNQD